MLANVFLYFCRMKEIGLLRYETKVNVHMFYHIDAVL